jgi:hypothetical protein
VRSGCSRSAAPAGIVRCNGRGHLASSGSPPTM